MKILIIGRGAISTQYAWAFEKAGHEVKFLVRPGKSYKYGTSVHLDIIDGRKKRKERNIKEEWTIDLIEEIPQNHDYDMIFVSVNHYQLDSVISLVDKKLGDATLFIFNNIWKDPLEIVNSLPTDQIVWGFPGGGGVFTQDNTLKGGFMKIITMGSIEKTSDPKRYKSVKNLFKKAGFSVTEEKDLKSWLWIHFILNCGLASQSLKVGGHAKVFDSKSNLKESILFSKEQIVLLKKKGGKVDLGNRILFGLPTGLVASIMKAAMTKGRIAGEIMEGALENENLSEDYLYSYSRDVYDESKRLNVELPRLSAMKELFIKK